MSERRVLRYWPWLVFCLVAFLVFGALAAVAGAAAVRTESVTLRVLNTVFGLGLAALAGYSLASLRVRTRLDEEGALAVGPFSRQRLAWHTVDRLDVAHMLAGWTVRGWSGDMPVVIFICHDTFGGRPKPETYDQPPLHLPVALQRGFVEIERRWRAGK